MKEEGQENAAAEKIFGTLAPPQQIAPGIENAISNDKAEASAEENPEVMESEHKALHISEVA